MRSPSTLTKLTALATLLAGCADPAEPDAPPSVSVRGALTTEADPPQPDNVLRVVDLEPSAPANEDAVRTLEPRIDDGANARFADGAKYCPEGAKYVDAKYLCDDARYAKY